jgi:preprotein translocase subunit SecF
MDDIHRIHERNARVEADKAWETSFSRRALIAVLTYFIVVVFLLLINAPSLFLTAFVPVGGYVLSTLSLPFVKSWWLANVYKK